MIVHFLRSDIKQFKLRLWRLSMNLFSRVNRAANPKTNPSSTRHTRLTRWSPDRGYLTARASLSPTWGNGNLPRQRKIITSSPNCTCDSLCLRLWLHFKTGVCVLQTKMSAPHTSNLNIFGFKVRMCTNVQITKNAFAYCLSKVEVFKGLVAGLRTGIQSGT